MTITWPDALKARRCNAHLRNFSRSGGRSITGREQRVFSDAGFWEVTISGIYVWSREEAQAYRSMIARLRQGEDIIVPVWDLYIPDGASSPSDISSVTLFAPAAHRATTLIFNNIGVDIKAGTHITIGDRVYVISEVLDAPETSPVINPLTHDTPWLDEPWAEAPREFTYYTVKILPPTRAVLSAGEPVRFRDLNVRCVLKDPADGDLDLDLGRHGEASLTFVEKI